MPTAKKPSATPAPARTPGASNSGGRTSRTGGAKKAGSKKAAAKKTPTKKTTAKKTTAKKTTAKKTSTEKATAKRSAAKATAAARTAEAKRPARARATAKKAASDKTTPDKSTAANSAPKTTAKKAGTTTAQKKEAVKQTTTTRGPVLPVRQGEDPWTPEEVAEIREELEREVARQHEQLQIVDTELAGLLRDGSDGAGRDSADIGSSNFERDQEMSLAANARAVLDQAVFALQRIKDGSYGICQNCGEPIGKGRLQAFPRASLCVKCKQREERR